MTILVVEDDKKIANFIKRGLEGEGYKVEVAHDGGNGLDLALDRTYGLIILDVMLAKKDGLTLLRALQGEEELYSCIDCVGKD